MLNNRIEQYYWNYYCRQFIGSLYIVLYVSSFGFLNFPFSLNVIALLFVGFFGWFLFAMNYAMYHLNYIYIIVDHKDSWICSISS